LIPSVVRSAAGWLFFAGASCACTSDLPSDLDGKACDRELRCASGFICDGASNRCVRPAELNASASSAAGSGALVSPNDPGDLEATNGEGRQVIRGDELGSGANPTGGSGGNTGLGSNERDGGMPLDGAAASGGSGDAPPDGGNAECSQQLLYPDRDGDGVGLTSGAQLRCAAQDWVSVPGDCRDDLMDVFLGQSRYFGMSYPEPTHADGVSFDFDCNGIEEPDPTNLTLAPVPDCSGLPLTCNQKGFLPAVSGRSGSGIDPRCGSNLLRQCVVSQLVGCDSETLVLGEGDRFRCR
jgi:hypothetical protein